MGITNFVWNSKWHEFYATLKLGDLLDLRDHARYLNTQSYHIFAPICHGRQTKNNTNLPAINQTNIDKQLIGFTNDGRHQQILNVRTHRICHSE